MPRLHIVLIVLLMVASVIGVNWLLEKAPAPLITSVELDNPVKDKAPAASNTMVDFAVTVEDGRVDKPPFKGTVEFRDDQLTVAGVGFRKGNLVLTLHDDTLFPLSDERIRLHRIGHEADEVTAVTDHRGEALFESIMEGNYLYTVEATGHPTMVASTPVYIKQGETTVLTLQLRDHDRIIGGWVINRHGVPVSGITVTARPHRLASGATPLRPGSPASARSNAEGRFKIGGLQAGEYKITTMTDKSRVTASAIVRAGFDSVVLTVAEHRISRIEGTVSSTSGKRLAGVKIMPPLGASGSVLTDIEGHYALTFSDDSTVVGRRYLRFQLDGYQETRVALEEALLEQGEPLSVETTLTSLGATVIVLGRVTDEYGSAVAGERVQFYSPSRYTTYRTRSGPNGEFTVGGVVASDDYRVWVRPKGPYSDYNEVSAALTHNRTYLDIVLPALAMGTVRGRVLDEQYYPVPDFHFWLRSDSAEGKAIPVTTDAYGSFTVEQVPAGQLTLGTRSLPHVRITDIELAAGSVQHIEVVLDQGDAR